MTGQNIRSKKVLPRHSTGSRSRKKNDKAVSFGNYPEKVLEQSQLAVERDKTKHKIGLGKPRTIALSRI